MSLVKLVLNCYHCTITQFLPQIHPCQGEISVDISSTNRKAEEAGTFPHLLPPPFPSMRNSYLAYFNAILFKLNSLAICLLLTIVFYVPSLNHHILFIMFKLSPFVCRLFYIVFNISSFVCRLLYIVFYLSCLSVVSFISSFIYHLLSVVSYIMSFIYPLLSKVF